MGFVMALFEVELLCRICQSPSFHQAEGQDEGEALFSFLTKVSQTRCPSCTSRGAFQVMSSRPLEPPSEGLP
jgi:hypothetical protein